VSRSISTSHAAAPVGWAGKPGFACQRRRSDGGLLFRCRSCW
jgi:hypothetical protein